MTTIIRTRIRVIGLAIGMAAGLATLQGAMAPQTVPRPASEESPELACGPAPSAGSLSDAKGEITIAKPKIWQSERVGALLDGLLRDIEGVSLADLTQLSPNTQNSAAVQFVQTALEVGAQFDQGAATTNRANLRNAEVERQTQNQRLDIYRQQLDADAAYSRMLNERRSQLATDLFAANTIVNTILPKHDAKTATEEEETQLVEAQTRVKTLSAELTDVNAKITAAGMPPASIPTPTLTNTLGGTAPPGLGATSAFGDMFKNLPGDVQNSISSALKSPNYPATKQLDNFLTLLHERMAREISVLQDDLTRDPNRAAFLVQFDTGLYPSAKADNHMARVEYTLACPECEVYSLYPGGSSYNVVNYQGVSKRRSFWGNIGTLVGLGISAGYRRQEDALQGNLVQSVYVSAFQEANQKFEETNQKDAAKFGWYFNAAPFDKFVTPGIRSTFALVTVPRNRLPKAKSCLTFKVAPSWTPRDQPKTSDTAMSRTVQVQLPGMDNLEERPKAVQEERDRLHVLRLEYNTVYHDGKDDASVPLDPLSACPRNRCAAVRITLDAPIDPNLVVTVKGRPLQRVRDWRGRATSILPAAQSLSDGNGTGRAVASRALTEVDQLQPDSWFATNSHDLLLNVSRTLAEEDWFPPIQISEPGKRALLLPNDLDRSFTELVINGYRIVPRTEEQVVRYVKARVGTSTSGPTRKVTDGPLMIGPYPMSTFFPLFAHDSLPRTVSVLVDASATFLRVSFNPVSDEKGKPLAFLPSRTQVILEDEELDFAWSLSCDPMNGELHCALPLSSIRSTYQTMFDNCRGCASIQQKADSAMDPIRLDAFVDSMQVWVEQYDPEEKDAFFAPHPLPLGLFPVNGDQFPAGSRYEPWRVANRDGVPPSPLAKDLKECNAFPWARSRLLVTPLSGDPTPRRIEPSDANGCRKIQLTAADLQLSSLEWRIEPESGQPDAKPTSNPMRVISVRVPSTKPLAKDPDVSFLREKTAPYTHTGWTVSIQISNGPGTATVEPAKGITEAGGKAQYAGGVVTLEIPKSAITKWPSKLTLNASGDEIDLPDARALLLPKTLTIRALGRTQFALTGDKAGAIDAVALLRGSKASTIVAATGANVATFDFNDAMTGGKNAPVVEGTYTILPLLRLPKAKGPEAFAPLEVVGADDKPLSLVVVKETEERPEEPGRRVTRIVQTIERSEKGGTASSTPAPATPAAPSKTTTANTGVIRKTTAP
jgi:hypothetical protein